MAVLIGLDGYRKIKSEISVFRKTEVRGSLGCFPCFPYITWKNMIGTDGESSGRESFGRQIAGEKSRRQEMAAADHVATRITEKNGREFLAVTLDGKEFDLPFKLISGKKVAFLDISGQHSLIEKSAELLVMKMREEGISFDTILNPVAKSNALAHAIAVRWEAQVDPKLRHTVVARKSKGEHHAVEASYKSVTTEAEQSLYITDEDAAYLKGKRVLLVDDVYGGGGTTKALRELVEKAGAAISGHAVIAVEDGGSYPEGLVYLYKLPVL